MTMNVFARHVYLLLIQLVLVEYIGNHSVGKYIGVGITRTHKHNGTGISIESKCLGERVLKSVRQHVHSGALGEVARQIL